VHRVVDGSANLPQYSWGWAGYTTQQSLAGCQAMPLGGLFGQSGTTISYWSCSTLVLGTLLEAFNPPWDSYIDAAVFKPAGMTSSGRVTDAVAVRTLAHDYDGATRDPNMVYNDYFEVSATAHDVYAYDNALFAGRLLSRASMTRLLTPRRALDLTDWGIAKPGVGYLWRMGRAFGHRVIYTIGESMDRKAFSTVNMRFPDAGVTVVILSNEAQDDVEAIALHTAAVVFGRPLPPRPGPLPTGPAALVGTYRRTFREADRQAARDPGLKDWVGGSITISIAKGAIHFALLDNLPAHSVDESYTATPDGRLTLVGYAPANHNTFCTDNPHQDPPPGVYRWARQGTVLRITRVSFDPCLDRGATLPGRWTKIG
jgi:CubicO group peptidase (beta-lactamase class C family)